MTITSILYTLSSVSNFLKYNRKKERKKKVKIYKENKVVKIKHRYTQTKLKMWMVFVESHDVSEGRLFIKSYGILSFCHRNLAAEVKKCPRSTLHLWLVLNEVV